MSWPTTVFGSVVMVSMASVLIGQWPILITWVASHGAGAVAAGGNVYPTVEKAKSS